ncbi:hypothetical protein D3C86_890640 [compost metagenome]
MDPDSKEKVYSTALQKWLDAIPDALFSDRRRRRMSCAIFIMLCKEIMEEVHTIFVDNLARIYAIRRARLAAVQYWGSDIPITVLLAELGRAIVDELESFSLDERAYIFDVVEQGMNSSDAVLNTAVATGLLEAISSQISKNCDLERKVDSQLGTVSKKYLIDWSSWQTSK